MDEYKIEDGIPFIENKKISKYPFKDMKVDQSFTVSKAEESQFRNSLNYYQLRNGDVKFKTRSIEGHKIRVWRVK